MITKLEIYALALVIMVAASLATLAYGYHWGSVAKDNENKAAYANQLANATEALKTDRDTAWALTQKYQDSLKTLQGNYDNVLKRRPQVLQTKFTCPPSGAIGDLVVPGVVVDSMFNASNPSDVPAARPAKP